MKEISIVIPVYKAEKIINELCSRLIKSLSLITKDFEIILVDDGSPDKSWEKISLEANNEARIKGFKLSRNFGQHHAITAGLDKSNADWVVVMDCDLQDRPEEIQNLYNKAKEGYDIVFARRINKQHDFRKKLSSKLFNKTFSYLTGTRHDSALSHFGIYNKKVISVIGQMREPMRAFLPMAKWVGFNKTHINVEHSKRFEGNTSYNLNKLLNLALDTAMAHSDKPIKMTLKVGFTISLISFIIAFISIIRYYLGYITISGYTSLIFSVWFLSGLIIFILGVIGLYISKIFDGVKSRPIYIISEETTSFLD